jgi:hypothetical protein
MDSFTDHDRCIVDRNEETIVDIARVTCYDTNINDLKGGAHMLPRLHPLAKTAIETRRAINRLLDYKVTNPEDSLVVDGTVNTIIEDLKSIRDHIPADLLDVDL